MGVCASKDSQAAKAGVKFSDAITQKEQKVVEPTTSAQPEKKENTPAEDTSKTVETAPPSAPSPVIAVSAAPPAEEKPAEVPVAQTSTVLPKAVEGSKIAAKEQEAQDNARISNADDTLKSLSEVHEGIGKESSYNRQVITLLARGSTLLAKAQSEINIVTNASEKSRLLAKATEYETALNLQRTKFESAMASAAASTAPPADSPAPQSSPKASPASPVAKGELPAAATPSPSPAPVPSSPAAAAVPEREEREEPAASSPRDSTAAQAYEARLLVPSPNTASEIEKAKPEVVSPVPAPDQKQPVDESATPKDAGANKGQPQGKVKLAALTTATEVKVEDRKIANVDAFVTQTIVIKKTAGNRLGIFVAPTGPTSVVPGIAVIEIKPGGSAAKSNLIKVGDQILSVNDSSLTGLGLDKAVKLLRSAQSVTSVKMEIVSTVQSPTNGSKKVKGTEV